MQNRSTLMYMNLRVLLQSKYLKANDNIYYFILQLSFDLDSHLKFPSNIN